MKRLRCEGWWEQDGYGRQFMDPLEVSMTDGGLCGRGTDMVGPFRLDGIVQQDHVSIVKQYIGGHRVHYYGNSDGEGTFHGNWRIGSFVGGNWLIRFRSARSSEVAEVVDITEWPAERG